MVLSLPRLPRAPRQSLRRDEGCSCCRRCIARGIEMPRGKRRSVSTRCNRWRHRQATQETKRGGSSEGNRYPQTVAYQRLREAGIAPSTIAKATAPKRGRRRVSVTVDELRRAGAGPQRVARAAVALGISQSTAYQMLREAGRDGHRWPVVKPSPPTARRRTPASGPAAQGSRGAWSMGCVGLDGGQGRYPQACGWWRSTMVRR